MKSTRFFLSLTCLCGTLLMAQVSEDCRVKSSCTVVVSKAKTVAAKNNEPGCSATKKTPACAASTNRCADYGACSISGDLRFAGDVELADYQQEKSEDNRRYVGLPAPVFALDTTADRSARLADFSGNPVALVFLAVHCSHSWDTLPILAELHLKYASSGLTVLPVFVNSGSLDDVRQSTSGLKLSLPLAVSPGKQLPLAYKSKLVPSTFLIDREGRITRKFVGFKDKLTLDTAFAELIGSGKSDISARAGD